MHGRNRAACIRADKAFFSEGRRPLIKTLVGVSVMVPALELEGVREMSGRGNVRDRGHGGNVYGGRLHSPSLKKANVL